MLLILLKMLSWTHAHQLPVSVNCWLIWFHLLPENLITSKAFLKNSGGAPGNTASGLAKLGVPGFHLSGKLETIHLVTFLKTSLDKYGVDTKGLVISKTDRTTLAFVFAYGNRRAGIFTFSKGTHTILPTEVTLPQATSIFHFGSLTQISGECE